MNETWGGGDEEGEGVTPDQIRLKNGYLWLIAAGRTWPSSSTGRP